jgi:hypothetical protein
VALSPVRVSFIESLYGAGMRQLVETPRPSTVRMRSLRRRQKRQLQMFKIEVAVPDLEVIAKHGYPDVLDPDAKVAAKAIEAYLSETVVP